MQRIVWGRVTSSNVMKVLWGLAELDLPFERIDAGGAFGKTDTAE
jgi:glutathione S-transferase